MANEINGSVNVHMTKSGIDLERTIGFILDMAGTHHNYTVVDVTNVAANIPFGSVVNPGLLLMHNREAPGGLSVDHGKVVAAAFEATTPQPHPLPSGDRHRRSTECDPGSSRRIS
jgi:hypothetical protein